MNIPEKLEFDVEQMAKLLNTRKNTGGPATVLFLGSRTGSLFRRPFLADQLKGFSNRDLLNMAPVERFRECYNILEEFKKQNQDSDIHFIIREALQKQHVEVADICVAELMKQGIFDFIITTNIGSELELAFRQSDMEEPRDFEVVIPGPGEAMAGKMTKGRTFKMIKASGDVFSKRYSIYGYNIGSKEIYLEKYPELKNIIEQVKEEDMFMVGFDYEWDKHIIHTIFPRREGSLWYVNEEQTTEDSQLFPYLKTCEAKRLEGTIGGYEPFFVNLCWHILGNIPTNQMTLDKLTKMEKTLNEMQDTQHKLQDGLGLLAKTVNKLLQSQEAMMKDIKGLSGNIDILLKQSGLNLLSDATSNPSANSISTSLEEEQGPARKTKQLEEN